MIHVIADDNRTRRAVTLLGHLACWLMLLVLLVAVCLPVIPHFTVSWTTAATGGGVVTASWLIHRLRQWRLYNRKSNEL
jgi:hypothetical protein